MFNLKIVVGGSTSSFYYYFFSHLTKCLREHFKTSKGNVSIETEASNSNSLLPTKTYFINFDTFFPMIEAVRCET